ncbi:MAG: RNA methyltransferase [Bacteroidota bacterium]
MLSKATIKDIQSLQHKKFRDESNAFLAEGPKVVKELLLSGAFNCKMVYALADWISKADKKLSDTFIDKVQIVTPEELEKIANYSTPNQVVAIFEKRKESTQIELKDQITLVLDDIQDPGNLGTIIRTSDWFGIKNIICSKNTADLYNSKVVQSTMASLARVNLYYTEPVEWLKKNKGVKVFAATLSGEPLNSFRGTKEAIVLIGNEANGLSEEIQAFASHNITIPGYGVAESLNAAIATAIILYELKN